MKKTTFLLVLALTKAFSVNAETKRGNEKISYEKKTHIDFEEKSVDGEFLKPDSQAVRGDQGLDFDSLMNPRTHFKKEIRRSAGAIR